MNNKTKILFFASNPEDVPQLSLDEEIREITTKIRASEFRDVLQLISRLAARPDDLLQELLENKPTIVHFSGHGSSSGELVLMDDSRKTKTVSPAALKALFTTLRDNIKVVVLNACYSKIQGVAISEVIDCVIGMNTSIGDRAAITFAASFYRAIGFGRSVGDAFELGKVSLMLEGTPEENTPELLHRPDIDPAKVFPINSTNPPQEKDYNIPNIIKLIKNSFSDTDLQQFCMINFNDVYNSFSDGMNKDQKILKLVDYAIRRILMDSLLDKLANTNQSQFDKNKPYYC